MVSDAEMARLRADAEALLRNTGRVHAYSQRGDGAGGTEETYTPGAELPCAIAPIGRSGGAATVAGDRINEASTHVTTWPVSTSISSQDRVEIDGTTYSVTALREFGEMAVTRRVEVKGL